MANCKMGLTSGWRRWAVRLCLGCALAGLLFSLPIEGGQAPHKSVRLAKTTAHRTAPPPVQLCVVVRNMRGLAVVDLRSSDFRLWDNNRLQRISDFAANIVPESVHHIRTPGSGRYIALYFDDLHYDFTQTIRVTDSAYSFFKSILGLGNKVGVFTASGDVTLDFTNNREKLHQALLAIKPHISTSRQAKACPELTDFQARMLLYGDDPLALKIALEDMNACSAPKGQPDPPASSLPVATLRRMKQTIDARARQVIAESEPGSLWKGWIS
jgi:VWFA-related protein